MALTELKNTISPGCGTTETVLLETDVTKYAVILSFNVANTTDEVIQVNARILDLDSSVSVWLFKNIEILPTRNISTTGYNETVSQERIRLFLEKIKELEEYSNKVDVWDSGEVNWEELPTVKKVGFDEEILRKYRGFITAFKGSVFNLETKMVSEYGNAYIKMEVDDPDIDVVYKDLEQISGLLREFKMDPDIYFDDQYIKIELK
jgi:uncharacterized protein (UPF0335 family)